MNFAAVGAFVLGLGAVLIMLALWLASGGGWQTKYVLYSATEDESVAGLNQDAPVKYNGVPVGRVSSIALDRANPQRVNLLFSIEEGTPIKVDTIAILKTQGLTGITYVELSGGTSNSPPLTAAPGQRHPVIRTQASLSARLENVLTSVLEKLDSTSTNVNAVFSAENQAAFKSALADMAVLARTLAARKDTIDSGIGNAGRTLQNTAKASARLDDVLNRVSGGADSFAKTGDTLAELERLLVELNSLSVSMRRLVEETERDPHGLLFGRKQVPPGPGEPQTAP